MSIFDLVDSISDDMFAVTGSPITYQRDGQTIAADIPAKIGSTLFRTDDRNGITLRVEQRDFIVRVSDAGGLDEPKKGDEIIWKGKVYMVSAPNGEPCWRWHTRQSHTQMRIHAKYIGDPDPEPEPQTEPATEPAAEQEQDDDE